MLHYSVDNELLYDIYNNYQLMEAKSLDTFHRLGSHYTTQSKGLVLDEKTQQLLDLLTSIDSETEAEALENKIIHGYITAKVGMKNEHKDFIRLCSDFDEPTRQALEGLEKHVVREKIIPYRIRNKVFHVDVVNSPAMIMQLDFENVLIADGRHPKEIYMTHLSGDKLENYYSLEFINGLVDEAYPSRENAFIFTGVKGNTAVYNYAGYQMPLEEGADKLQWRLLYQGFDAVIGKINILGLDSLNDEEQAALPLLCVFYELIGFYLEEDTIAGIGKSLISFDPQKAKNFAFSQNDIDMVCDILAPYDLADFCMHFRKAMDDMTEFCTYWIAYASSRKSEQLYLILKQMLSACGASYPSHPKPLVYRHNHVTVRRKIMEAFEKRGFKGQYPFYRMEIQPQFLEVSSVYSKMYTYINEKKKVYYVDFFESATDETYVVTAICGFVLLRDREKPEDFCALRGYFTDGGRRNVQVVHRMTIPRGADVNQVEHLTADMLEDVFTKGVSVR